MQRAFFIASGLTLATGGVVWAGLPQSMNFENVTSTRINQTVGEGSANEKEVEFGDLDNDNDMDVVIGVGESDFGQRRNKMYRNDGGTFNEVSGVAITSFSSTDTTRNAFIRDFNNDGWMDVYIINDSNSGGFAGQDHLYINQQGGLNGGNNFVDEGSSRIASSGALGAACGGVSADFDQDGDMDVYSGNYPGPSQDVGLYNNLNNIAGTDYDLLNLTGTMVPADGDYTVDVALGDMNGDGKDDLLVSNWGNNYVYYNDKNGNTSTGDYRYSGSAQSLLSGGADENAMEPGDFDNDGDLDFYWSNASGSNGDRIYENTGNSGSNVVIWSTLNILPSSVTGSVSRKASVGDMNNDGKVDIFVATQSGNRPTVLRNTSLDDGPISFVDWTPADEFSNGSTHRGWHGAVFDTNGDGDKDILLGAFSNDYLFESVPGNEVTEDSLGGVLPGLWNIDPVAVTGSAGLGDTDTYRANDIASGLVSVVVNGPDDYELEVRNASNGSLIASSDRGGLGVEEALQISSSVDIDINVIVNASTGGTCGPPDFDGNCEVGFSDLTQLLANWGCTGCVYDMDGGGAGFSDLTILLAAWGPIKVGTNDYLLEVLGRSG